MRGKSQFGLGRSQKKRGGSSVRCNDQLAAAAPLQKSKAGCFPGSSSTCTMDPAWQASGWCWAAGAGERWQAGHHLPTWPAAAAAPGQHWESTGQPVFQLIPSFRCRRPIFGPWIIGVGGWSGKWEEGSPPLLPFTVPFRRGVC